MFTSPRSALSTSLPSSMLDAVLSNREGIPISIAVLHAAVSAGATFLKGRARRASGILLAPLLLALAAAGWASIGASGTLPPAGAASDCCHAPL